MLAHIPRQRVYLVDQQALFIESFKRVLDSEPWLDVVGASNDSDQAIQEIDELQPEIVITDVELPGRGAMTLAGEVRKRYPAIKLVFLASYLSHVCLDEALRLNVHGYLLKADSIGDVLDAMHRIAAGEKCYSKVARHAMSKDRETNTYRVDAMSELSTLTGRQMEVLRQLSRGRSVKEVARTMSISERAVESHKYRIMRKLGIHDRVDLAMFAVREGLVVLQR